MTESRKYAKGLAVREEFVEAAAGLFAVRGFNASSIADITAATGLTKNQFFHHFGTKQALGLSVIEKAQRAWETEIIAPAVMYPDPTHQLVAFNHKLVTLTAQGWPYLKLLATLSNEASVLSSELQQALTALSNSVLESLRSTFKCFKRDGIELPVVAKARTLAALVFSLWLGAASSGTGDTALTQQADIFEVTCQLFGLDLNSA